MITKQSENKVEDLVSIIMPSYNCEEFIGTTIDFVTSQTYQNWELVIVDDCSTDNPLHSSCTKQLRVWLNLGRLQILELAIPA